VRRRRWESSALTPTHTYHTRAHTHTHTDTCTRAHTPRLMLGDTRLLHTYGMSGVKEEEEEEEEEEEAEEEEELY